MAQGRVRNTSSLSRTALPLIDIQHVSYSYPLPAHHPNDVAIVPALQDISLSIEQGEYVALLGHNGSGKSTLARLCNALLLPDQGVVRVQGMDTRDQVKQRQIRECVGIIFQNPDNQLIATLVEDDVAWSLTLAGYAAPTIRARVDQALAAVGIEHLRYLAPHSLSGGQRQRVAIAGLLALRPACIIADESTSMLDPLSRQEMVSVLTQLHHEQQLSILHVTHLLEEVLHAQRVVVMEQGRIVQSDTPEVVFADLERLRELKLIIPESLALAERLRLAGWPIARSALTLSEIAREIQGVVNARRTY
ncbi:energy-coupling factor transporter ATP-binding protein EcfA1 [Ktedonobacteria bacterium brp13]|nr:energy-coupling factor transporter ATP-binding protein EcfA1 [Ktedonobacteria bacterium brp13]